MTLKLFWSFMLHKNHHILGIIVKIILQQSEASMQ